MVGSGVDPEEIPLTQSSYGDKNDPEIFALIYDLGAIHLINAAQLTVQDLSQRRKVLGM